MIFEDTSASSDDEQDETSDDSGSDSDVESEEPIPGIEVIIYDGEDIEVGSSGDPGPDGTAKSSEEPPAGDGDAGSATPPPFIVDIGFANPPEGDEPEPGRFGGIPGLAPRPGLAASPLARELPVAESPALNPPDVLAEAGPDIALPGQIESKEASVPQTEPAVDDSLDVFDTKPASDEPPQPTLEPDKEAESPADLLPADTGPEAEEDNGSDAGELPPLSFSTPSPREFGQGNSEPAEPAGPGIVTSDPGREFGRGPRQVFDFGDDSESSLVQDTSEQQPSDFEDDDDVEPDDDDLGF